MTCVAQVKTINLNIEKINYFTFNLLASNKFKMYDLKKTTPHFIVKKLKGD